MQAELSRALELDRRGGDRNDLRGVRRLYRRLLIREPHSLLLWTRWVALHLDCDPSGRAERFPALWEMLCERVPASERRAAAGWVHVQLLLRLGPPQAARLVLDDLQGHRGNRDLQQLHGRWQLQSERERCAAPLLPYWRVRAGWWRAGPLLLPERLEGERLRRWGLGRVSELQAMDPTGACLRPRMQGDLFDLEALSQGQPPLLDGRASCSLPLGPDDLRPGQLVEAGWYGPQLRGAVREVWMKTEPDWQLPQLDMPPERWQQAGLL